MRLYWLLPAALLPAFTCLAAPAAGSVKEPACAQGDVNLELNLANAPVSDLLTALSRQLRRPVAMDGAPQAQTVGISYSGPSESAIQAIGRTLDAEIRLGKTGAVLIVPRFTRGDGLPQAIPAEMEAVAAGVLRILPAASPSPNHHLWGENIRELGRALAPAQAAALRSGATLEWVDLTPAQQHLVTKAIYNRLWSGPRYYWTLLRAVAGSPEKTLVRSEERTHHLIIEPPRSAGLDPVRTGISLTEDQDAPPPEPARELTSEAARKEMPPRSGPPSLDAAVSFDAKPASIQEIAADLHRSTGIEIKLPVSVRQRVVSIAADSRPAREVLSALCELEGWTWRETIAGREAVIERPFAGLRPGETVYQGYRRQLPPDLVQYLRMPPPEKYTQGMGDHGVLQSQAGSLARTLKHSLRAFESKLANGVAISELTPLVQQQVLLAVLLAPSARTMMVEIQSNSEWYFARPDASRLQLEQGAILMIEFRRDGNRQIPAFGARVLDP